jgi:acetylglutamate kinase
VKALELGVTSTHILDGRSPHSLLIEIFSDRGMGTMIV